MKAIDIINTLYEFTKNSDFGDYANTCDTCKAGDMNTETDKIAVSMFATPQVIRQARDWGAQLLIVHEPTYYNHWDEHSDEKIECEKRKLIEDSGLTIFRYHDHAHFTLPDMIAAGELRQFGLSGRIEYTDIIDLVRLHLDTPITPLELARIIEDRCNIKHIRICGSRTAPCTVISGMFGTPGKVFEELQSDQCEILLTGEACEWSLGEYARDAAQLGHKKALIIMGHIGSERDGMKYVSDILKERLPGMDVRYFECGEVYTYTDSEE